MKIVLNFISSGDMAKLTLVDEKDMLNPFCMDVPSDKWVEFLDTTTPRMTLYPRRSGWHTAMVKVEITDEIKFKGLVTEEQAQFIVDTYGDRL